MKPYKKKLITSSSSEFRSEASESVECKDAVSDFSQHEKTFDQAIPYIWDYVNRFPGLALNAGSGAEICRSHLADFESLAGSTTTSSDLHCGLLIYFCCYEGAFFLAYRPVNRMDHTLSQSPPMDDVPYYLSDCEFVFNVNDITSLANLTAALNNFRHVCDCADEPAGVFKHNIREYGELFLNSFNPDLLVYPIGFFHWDQVYKLLTQNDGTASQCTGIRFYWGHQDLNLSGGDNDGYKIKLVAFGIDPDGGNVINSGDIERLMLEQSWPPF